MKLCRGFLRQFGSVVSLVLALLVVLPDLGNAEVPAVPTFEKGHPHLLDPVTEHDHAGYDYGPAECHAGLACRSKLLTAAAPLPMAAFRVADMLTATGAGPVTSILVLFDPPPPRGLS